MYLMIPAIATPVDSSARLVGFSQLVADDGNASGLCMEIREPNAM